MRSVGLENNPYPWSSCRKETAIYIPSFIATITWKYIKSSMPSICKHTQQQKISQKQFGMSFPKNYGRTEIMFDQLHSDIDNDFTMKIESRK